MFLHEKGENSEDIYSWEALIEPELTWLKYENQAG